MPAANQATGPAAAGVKGQPGLIAPSSQYCWWKVPKPQGGQLPGGRSSGDTGTSGESTRKRLNCRRVTCEPLVPLLQCCCTTTGSLANDGVKPALSPVAAASAAAWGTGCAPHDARHHVAQPGSAGTAGTPPLSTAYRRTSLAISKQQRNYVRHNYDVRSPLQGLKSAPLGSMAPS